MNKSRILLYGPVFVRFSVKKSNTISLGVAVEKTSRPPRLNKKNKEEEILWRFINQVTVFRFYLVWI